MELEKVSTEKDVLNLDALSPEEKQKVEQMTKEIALDDTQSIIQFGVSAQSSISSFADTMLDGIRTKDTGFVGEVLSDLMMRVKSLNVEKLSTSEGFLSKIPLLGNLVDNIKRFIARYEEIAVHIDRIVDELTKARMQLLKDITMLDTMYEKNQEYLQALDLYILAGKIKLKEIEEQVIPEMRTKAEESKDPVDAQKVQDVIQMASRLDKKVHDLQLSRMVALQTSPQVRLIQSNDQVLVEKIQSSLLNTIPLWKNQVIIAISLFRQKKAVELQKEVSETTNELLSKNAELLKENSIEVARETERGIVEIKTLKDVHNKLIETIEETLKIQEEGKSKRREAEVELQKLETDLNARLTAAKASDIKG